MGRLQLSPSLPPVLQKRPTIKVKETHYNIPEVQKKLACWSQYPRITQMLLACLRQRSCRRPKAGSQASSSSAPLPPTSSTACLRSNWREVTAKVALGKAIFSKVKAYYAWLYICMSAVPSCPKVWSPLRSLAQQHKASSDALILYLTNTIVNLLPNAIAD